MRACDNPGHLGELYGIGTALQLISTVNGAVLRATDQQPPAPGCAPRYAPDQWPKPKSVPV